MFIGHFAVGFGLKRAAPRLNLGVLFLAVQWVDLVWPLFLLAGGQPVRALLRISPALPADLYYYPLTHSLAGVLGWSVVLGGGYYLYRRNARGAFILAAGVLSHWPLDLLVHQPDLTLWPGADLPLGFGPWFYARLGWLHLEYLLYAAGVGIYLFSTRALNRAGSWGLWLMVLLLPPVQEKIQWDWIGNLMWVLLPWAWLVDRNRRPAAGETDKEAE